MNDKNSLEKVQRCAARYVKGIYTYDAKCLTNYSGSHLSHIEINLT